MTIIILVRWAVCLQLIQTSAHGRTVYEKAWRLILNDRSAVFNKGRDNKSLWKIAMIAKKTKTTHCNMILFYLLLRTNPGIVIICRPEDVPDFNLSSALAGGHFVRYWWDVRASIYSLEIHYKYTKEIILLILLTLVCSHDTHYGSGKERVTPSLKRKVLHLFSSTKQKSQNLFSVVWKIATSDCSDQVENSN